MHVLHVVGARPNFMKVAPVFRALSAKSGVRQTLVHTGQHYDRAMSGVFFEELGMPEPDINLSVGSGTHSWQTAEIMKRLEPVLLEQRPDVTLVYGDVNSTAATALVCSKIQSKIGHVEAGLRSFDRTMPEEVNRLVTDQLADMLFTPSRDGDENLMREGVPRDRIHFVGNVMIDTLVRFVPMAASRWGALPDDLRLDRYGLVTLHRPSNVDKPESLSAIVAALQDISKDLPLIFPIHPRTLKNLGGANGFSRNGNLRVVDPLSYIDFLALQQRATIVITDSGGIQEESTYLGVPCLTLRDNTERPVTVTSGTNVLVGSSPAKLKPHVDAILGGNRKKGSVPELWDGNAAGRIADLLTSSVGGR